MVFETILFAKFQHSRGLTEAYAENEFLAQFYWCSCTGEHMFAWVRGQRRDIRKQGRTAPGGDLLADNSGRTQRALAIVGYALAPHIA